MNENHDPKTGEFSSGGGSILDKLVTKGKLSAVVDKISKDNEIIYYHGTTPSKYEKMKQSGFLAAHKSDDEEFGDSVWLTSDPEEARTYGSVVLAVRRGDIVSLKQQKILPLPESFKKKLSSEEWNRLTKKHHLVVQQNIPLKHFTILDLSKTKH
jgi:hypothetical protein